MGYAEFLHTPPVPKRPPLFYGKSSGKCGLFCCVWEAARPLLVS